MTQHLVFEASSIKNTNIGNMTNSINSSFQSKELDQPKSLSRQNSNKELNEIELKHNDLE